jgi:hypothetical protein
VRTHTRFLAASFLWWEVSMDFAERACAGLNLREVLIHRLTPAEFRELWNELKAPLRAWLEEGRRPPPVMAFDARLPPRVAIQLTELLADSLRGRCSDAVVDRAIAFAREIAELPELPQDAIDWARAEEAAGRLHNPRDPHTWERCEEFLEHRIRITREIMVSVYHAVRGSARRGRPRNNNSPAN